MTTWGRRIVAAVTRGRPVLIAVASGVVILGALLALHRVRSAREVAPAPAVELAPPVEPLDEPLPVVEVEERIEPAERRLPNWARAAIVGAALVAFFAVSLIAKKV
jgi:hypothetical protein